LQAKECKRWDHRLRPKLVGQTCSPSEESAAVIACTTKPKFMARDTGSLWLALLIIAYCMIASSARSAPLRIAGTAGYLAEWELSGNAAEQNSANATEFSGPLIWKHVGLCSQDGPQEKWGQIDIRVLGSGSSSRIHVTLSQENISCTYVGSWSERSSGLMDCSDTKGVPLTLLFNER